MKKISNRQVFPTFLFAARKILWEQQMVLNMTKFQRIVIVFVSILVYALVCPVYSSSDEPDWYTVPPEDSDYYYGVGYSTKSMNDAEGEARVNMILGIAATIRVEDEGEQTSRDDGKYENIKMGFGRKYHIYAEQEALPGVKIAKRHNPHSRQMEYYALARLSQGKLRQYTEKRQEEVKRHAEHGDKKLKEGNIIAALKVYREALKIAQKLKFLYSEIVNIPDGTSDVEIQERIDSIQNDIHILKFSGDEQTCDYGNSLPEALVVQVYYRNKPLTGFPLKAIYTRGIGQLKNEAGETGLSVRMHTDKEGEARCWVKIAKSISRENYIRIKEDTESNESLKSKVVNFRYTSLFPTRQTTGTPIVTFNGSSTEQTFSEGSKVDIEISVPNKCHIHLFSIVANGDFGYMQSVPIERTYEGKRWRVISTNSGWALQMHQVPLTADYGLGLETFLVVTTEDTWEPERKQFTMNNLIRQLDNSVGKDGWRVGWVSYYIVSKEVLAD